ncbi:UNVERIFIED_CONTAM: hypothetical protein FKN15_064601 [Acipenser sinensis]
MLISSEALSPCRGAEVQIFMRYRQTQEHFHQRPRPDAWGREVNFLENLAGLGQNSCAPYWQAARLEFSS